MMGLHVSFMHPFICAIDLHPYSFVRSFAHSFIYYYEDKMYNIFIQILLVFHILDFAIFRTDNAQTLHDDAQNEMSPICPMALSRWFFAHNFVIRISENFSWHFGHMPRRFAVFCGIQTQSHFRTFGSNVKRFIMIREYFPSVRCLFITSPISFAKIFFQITSEFAVFHIFPSPISSVKSRWRNRN